MSQLPTAQIEDAKGDEDIVFGVTERHLVSWANVSHSLSDAPCFIHREVAPALADLRSRAAEQGFDLFVCSGFRSFERQSAIWNDKLSGRRPVLDKMSRPLQLDGRSDWDRVEAVLRWSALPGASRHHWGTDIDVYDAAAIPKGYQLQLIPEETEAGGVFASMHAWLDTELAARGDFYRPYAQDRGGVLPERWHLSYAPLASYYAAQHNPEALAQRLRDANISQLDTVLRHLDVIYQRFICNL